MAKPDRVLLINPNISDSEANIIGYKVFPIGLGLLAALCEKKNIGVTIFDIRIASLETEAVTSRLKELLHDHEVVGISAIINCLGYVEWLSAEIKRIKPSAKIILGGSICSSILSILAKTTMCDYFCIGEGEETFLELLSFLEGKMPKEQIKGIAYKNDNFELVITPPRERLKDLDSIPLPAYHLFDTQAYSELPSRVPNVGKNMGVIAGRGCPFSCTYCLPAFGHKVVKRSAASIIEELELLKSEYGVKHIDFMDDLLCFKETWMIEFSQALADSGLDITWRGLGRANAFSKFKDSTIKLMKQSGCHWIGFGFESASPKILKIMRKQNTLEQMQKSVDLCRKHRINITGTFIMGMPGETKDTLEETFRFIYDNYLWPHFSFACPYPGTPLYDYAKEKGIILDDESFIRGIQSLNDIYTIVCDMSEDELRECHRKIQEKVFKRLHELGIFHPTALKGFEIDDAKKLTPVF